MTGKRERKKIVSVKALTGINKGKDYEPPLDSPLAEKQAWAKEQALKLEDGFNSFKEKIIFYCQDPNFRFWIQTTTQSQLAEEWGIGQSNISRAVGTVQKDFKDEVREQAISMRRDKKPINEIVQELPIEVSPKTVRRWCEKELHPKQPNKSKDAAIVLTEQDSKMMQEGYIVDHSEDQTKTLETIKEKCIRLESELEEAKSEIRILKINVKSGAKYGKDQYERGEMWYKSSQEYKEDAEKWKKLYEELEKVLVKKKAPVKSKTKPK